MPPRLFLSVSALLCLLAAPASVRAQDWTLQDTPTTVELNRIAMLDTDRGYAVGEVGVLLTTSDGGVTWTVTNPTADDLEDVAFNATGSVGLIAVGNGSVLRTTDGATWTATNTGADDLRAIAWGTPDVAFAAGDDGQAVRTADGGVTWQVLATGAVERFRAAAAVSANEAWLVGDEGLVRHTADGGFTWTPQNPGTDEDLRDIQMLSSEVGYIVGSGSTVLKTGNGGATWTSVSDGAAGGEGLAFVSESTGWVVDDAGLVFVTDDGGVSWQVQSTPTGADLGGVAFASVDRGWAVGSGGTVIAYGAGGTAAESHSRPARAMQVFPTLVTRRVTGTLALTDAGPVRVEVFDALGRRVALLHDGPVAAGAVYPFEIDASTWPSGVYFVRARGAEFTLTRRVLRVRS